jgi:ferric-dicitrate binding protein FerR (iron transport regulator)
MTQEEFSKLLERYIRGECTPQEEEFILKWYDTIHASHYGAAEDTSEATEARLWEDLQSKLKRTKKSSFYYTWRVAAAILMLVATGAVLYFARYGFTSREESVALLEPGQKYTGIQLIENKTNIPHLVRLTDGSEVTLEPGSELRVANKFTNNKREVYLTGEAFFHVKRDTLRPFLVYANEVITKVLGTSFTVKAYKGAKQTTVAVMTGKVSVSTNPEVIQKKHTTQEVILTPNQEAVYNRAINKVTKKLVDVPRIVLEKPTLFEMKYDATPVSQIFEVLEENYGVEIIYDEKILSECFLTTSMSDEGLYQRIEIICKAIGAEYKIQDTTITITGKGCQ